MPSHTSSTPRVQEPAFPPRQARPSPYDSASSRTPSARPSAPSACCAVLPHASPSQPLLHSYAPSACCSASPHSAPSTSPPPPSAPSQTPSVPKLHASASRSVWLQGPPPQGNPDEPSP